MPAIERDLSVRLRVVHHLRGIIINNLSFQFYLAFTIKTDNLDQTGQLPDLFLRRYTLFGYDDQVMGRRTIELKKARIKCSYAFLRLVFLK